jgi:antitoxin (DNA-binding transcriptional repressor) of toxin-antitoxin stability system
MRSFSSQGQIMMSRCVSITTAKTYLSVLADEASNKGQHVIIERRGQPIAAIVGMDALARLEESRPAPVEPRGALAFLSVTHDLTDKEIDALVDDIYVQSRST